MSKLARVISALCLLGLIGTTAQAGTLAALRFETPLPSQAPRAAVGTVDEYMGQPSQALLLRADFSAAKAGRQARTSISTGRIAVRNAEPDLAKLSLSVDLNPSVLHPVLVTIASIAADGRRSGTLQAQVVPPVAGSFYRHGLDLAQMKPVAGRFDPLAPAIEVTLALRDEPGLPLPRDTKLTLAVDNLSYTAPSFYVSPQGSDLADGRSAERAFATLQHAADVARAGDVVLVMEGRHLNSGKPDISGVPAETQNSPDWRPWWVPQTGSNMTIRNAGNPAEWIVFRNHPGQQPVTYHDGGWAAVKLDLTAAYVELRGLTIEGNRRKTTVEEALADGAIGEKDGVRYHGAARYSGNAILADGRPGKTHEQRPHHLRFINNTLFDNGGAGITLIGAEHVAIEGNVARDNCHTMRYASSGFSTLLNWNWDNSGGHKIFFLRNTSHGNQTFVPWGRFLKDEQGRPIPNKLSDGNGIIVDVNRNSLDVKSIAYGPYTARTLVQNNLVYNNGGSGIHTVNADRVDIIANTAYLNSASPALQYPQIYAGWSRDVQFHHNIMVAPVANVAAGEPPEGINNPKGGSTELVFANNLYWGGNEAPVMGAGDRIADPRFVNASIYPQQADFRLRADSPARAAGKRSVSHLPLDDLSGALRDPVRAPDIGAIRYQP